jgi:hypothetical protein
MKQLRMGGTPLNGKTVRERTTVEKGAGILNRNATSYV